MTAEQRTTTAGSGSAESDCRHLARSAAVDILDPGAVGPLLDGVDAVVRTVGVGTSKLPTTLYSEVTATS